MSTKAVYRLARGVGLTHDQAVTATAIAWAESKLDPDAVGDITLQDSYWGPSVGLWQVRSVKRQRGTGGVRDASHLSDATFNARSMASISGGGHNWGPWSTYNSGAYLSHIAAVRKAVGDGSTTPQGRAPRGTTTADTVAWTPDLPNPGDVAGALIPGAGPVIAGLDAGGKAAKKAAGAALDLTGVRELVLTGTVVLGGVLLVLAGAAAMAHGGGSDG